jgi:hypothetical protein
MRIVRDASEDEMVFEFLSAELHSGLFGEKFVKPCLKAAGADRSLLYSRDFDNANSNRLRRQVLGCYRGFGQATMLFNGFPANAQWKLVEVTVEELGGFYYAATAGVPEWSDLSKGSRLVRDGARYLGETQAAEASKPHILEIEKRVNAGEGHAPLIALSEGINQPHILLEGHKRATAYLRVRGADETVEVLVGYADDLSPWEYGLHQRSA